MKKIVIVASTFIIALFSYFALTHKDGESSIVLSNTSKPTKIGVIIPLTGIVSAFGEEEKRGIESAKSSDVEIIYENDQCDPKLAVSSFKKLTELDHVNVIIGPMCGSSQEAVAPLAKDKGVLLLLPAAASSHLFEVSGGSMYNTQYSLESESAFNARELIRLNYNRVALISYPNSYSKTHIDSFKKVFTGTIVSDIILPADVSVPQFHSFLVMA
jgi:ABC-type branched-subunit amino acid transport system substrate-binding protein